MEIFLKLDWTYIVFYCVTALWIGEFLLFPSKYKSDDYSEKKSFRRILSLTIMGIGMTLLLSYFKIAYIEGLLGEIASYTGLIVYSLGILLRYSGAIYLGKYFTRDVEVSSDHELVSEGPYRILRHPLYLGLYFLSIGVPLFFRNTTAFLFTAIAMGLILNKRMVMEEKSMEATIGNRYTEWKSNRYRFIPYIY